MLRDTLSDGIRVGSHFIKECALQLKASISLKGLQLVMDKNQEVAEAYSKNINVRKTKNAAEFAFFHESTKCRRLIRKKQSKPNSGVRLHTMDIYLEKEIRSRNARTKEFIYHNDPKSSGTYYTLVSLGTDVKKASIWNVAILCQQWRNERKWLLKRLDNRKNGLNMADSEYFL